MLAPFNYQVVSLPASLVKQSILHSTKLWVIQLPSERTLRDQQHCIPVVLWFLAETYRDHLVQQLQSTHLEEYVTVVMCVKEGLVFDKATGLDTKIWVTSTTSSMMQKAGSKTLVILIGH